MKVFVFDLLPYAEHLEHLKVGTELPWPLPRQHFKPEVAVRTYAEHLAAYRGHGERSHVPHCNALDYRKGVGGRRLQFHQRDSGHSRALRSEDEEMDGDG